MLGSQSINWLTMCVQYGITSVIGSHVDNNYYQPVMLFNGRGVECNGRDLIPNADL